jgi:hypothetical protein
MDGMADWLSHLLDKGKGTGEGAGGCQLEQEEDHHNGRFEVFR